MPVPSTIAELSTTPGSNSPAGSESPNILDDYMRTAFSFIKQLEGQSVNLTGNQTIAGVKTFSTPISIASGGTGDSGGSNLVPAGAVMMFASSTPPAGWLKASGAAVSRTAYASLFAAIGTTFGAGDGSTTFNLPDMRGEFPRGWDDGRGVDSGRALGSAQSGQNAAHTHNGSTASSGTHTHAVAGGVGGATQIMGDQSGVFAAIGPGAVPSAYYTQYGGSNILQTAGAHTHTFTTDSSGGSEARPRNVALLACIKF